VLDGDPNKNNDGMGWVQIGDPGRLGKNHKEAHGADCTWGGLSQAPHWKGPWIYCVIDEAVTTKTGNWAGWDVANFVSDVLMARTSGDDDRCACSSSPSAAALDERAAALS